MIGWYRGHLGTPPCREIPRSSHLPASPATAHKTSRRSSSPASKYSYTSMKLLIRVASLAPMDYQFSLPSTVVPSTLSRPVGQKQGMKNLLYSCMSVIVFTCRTGKDCLFAVIIKSVANIPCSPSSAYHSDVVRVQLKLCNKPLST